MLHRILPLLALGLAVSAAPARAQYAQLCGGITLAAIVLDPRSTSDERSSWVYGANFGNRGGTRNVVVTFVGPPGTVSQANGRAMSLPGGTLTQVPLVQWPKSMAQPSLSDVAAGIRMECR
jgi:hypothetical protein